MRIPEELKAAVMFDTCKPQHSLRAGQGDRGLLPVPAIAVGGPGISLGVFGALLGLTLAAVT